MTVFKQYDGTGDPTDAANWATILVGTQGVQGDIGPTGPAGADGVGVPAGGIPGQVLSKNSPTDYDTDWVDPPSPAQTINAQTGTSYTLVIGDNRATVTMDNGSASTLTIPTNASVAFPVGSRVEVVRLGAGTVTIGGSGVTVVGTTTPVQYALVTLRKLATDTWVSSP